MITDLKLTLLPLILFSSEEMASDFSMDEPSENSDEEDLDDGLLDGESESDSDDDMVSEEDY